MKIRWFLLVGVLTLNSSALWADDLPGLQEPLKTVVQQYLVIEQKLVADSFDGVAPASAKLKAALETAPASTFPNDLIAAGDAMAEAKDLHTARLALKELSNDLIATLAHAQAKTGALHSAYCPMRRAYWIQADGTKIANPYYGSAMLDCGSFEGHF